MKDVLGNHFEGPIIHWLSITRELRRHQFGESLTWIIPRIRSVRGVNLEGDVLIADLEELKNDGRIGNLLKKSQCERGDIFQTRRIYFSNRRWTNQKPLEEIRT